MWYAFHTSDYYDPPALCVSHQPQLVQSYISYDQDTKFPRSQRCTVTVRFRPPLHPSRVEGLIQVFPLFVLPSSRSSRPRRKCVASTPIARGICTFMDCFSSHQWHLWDYLPSASHIAALRCLVVLRFQTRIQHCTTSV